MLKRHLNTATSRIATSKLASIGCHCTLCSWTLLNLRDVCTVVHGSVLLPRSLRKTERHPYPFFSEATTLNRIIFLGTMRVVFPLELEFVNDN